MAKNATGLPLSQSNANVSLECHSDRFRSHFSQIHLEMNSISNISQSSVTLPLDCHSDQVSVNGKDFMLNHATGLPLSQFNATVSLECQSDHFQSNFLQIHLRMRLIGRFPIYIGKRPISRVLR